MRRPPMYEVAAGDLLRASAAAAASALALGYAAAMLLPARPFAGFFGLTLALLAGWGGGVLAATAVSRAAGGKRGLAVQLLAAGAIVAAGAVRLVAGGDLSLITQDLAGPLAVAAGVAVAWQRLG